MRKISFVIEFNPFDRWRIGYYEWLYEERVDREVFIGPFVFGIIWPAKAS